MIFLVPIFVLLLGVGGGILLFISEPVIDKVFKYDEEAQIYRWFDPVYNLICGFGNKWR